MPTRLVQRAAYVFALTVVSFASIGAGSAYAAAPICGATNIVVNEDQSVNIAPNCALASGTGPLHFNPGFTGASHGSVSISGTGPGTYTPHQDYSGVDSFTVWAQDVASGDQTETTINVTINPINDPPSCSSRSGSADEETSTPLTLTCSDPDSLTIYYSLVNFPALPAHGSLLWPEGGVSGHQILYTGAANYVGSDSFQWQATDSHGATSNIATFTVNVNNTPDTPACSPQSLGTDEDTPLNGTVSCSDPDPVDGKAYGVVSQPDHGLVSINASSGAFTYTPTDEYSGPDSFVFKATDNLGHVGSATVDVSVSAVNDPPTCTAPATLNATEDTVSDFNITCGDIDSAIVSYSVGAAGDGEVTQPLGTASNAVSYEPDANFNGSDSFDVRANDGEFDSTPLSVAVTVAGTNDVPTCDAYPTLSTAEDTAFDFAAVCSDIDVGDTLSYITTDGAHGSVAPTAGGATPAELTYSPSSNYYGSDSFTFKVNDGSADSDPRTVAVTVEPVTDAAPPACAPHGGASSFQVSTDEDTPVEMIVECADPDNDAITYSVGAAEHGTVSGTAPTLLYTPNSDYHGNDSFTVSVSDGTSSSVPMVISLSVVPINDAPTCNAIAPVTVAEDASVNITASCSDVDGDSLSYETTATNGVVTGTYPSYTYTPTPNFSGSASFSIVASDGSLPSDSQSAAITVTPLNDAPVCTSASTNTNEDTQAGGALDCSDVDGDTLTVSRVANVTHGGTVVNGDGSWSYDPTAQYHGSDSFTFKANDATVDSNTATMSLTVASVNDVPVCTGPTALSADEDVEAAVHLACTDNDPDASLTYTITTLPTRGTLTQSGASTDYSYKSNLNESGADFFEFKANDGIDDSITVRTDVTVNPVNDPPACSEPSYEAAEDGQIIYDLSGLCSDLENDAIGSYQIDDDTDAHGTVTIDETSGQYTYTPETNFFGTATFTYSASDGDDRSVSKTVTIYVNGSQDAPVCTAPAAKSGDEDTSVLIAADEFCDDPDGDTLVCSSVGPPSSGGTSIAEGKCQYQGAQNFYGSDEFEFAVSDGTESSNTITASITVNAVNDAPACSPIISTLGTEDTVFSGVRANLNCFDPEGDTIGSFTITDSGEDGTATIDASSGGFTFTPDANFNGYTKFYFTASDGTATSGVIEANIGFTAVNDAPVCTDLTGASKKTLDEDDSATFDLPCTDVDGNSLSFSFPSGPSHGTMTPQSGASYLYQPDSNFNGDDTMTVKANDGAVDSNTSAIDVSLTAVNDAPSCDAVNPVATAYQTSVSVTPTCTDAESDAVHFVAGTAANGTVTVSGSSITYQPNAGFSGDDTFTFTGEDTSNAASPEVSVTVTVGNPPPPPTPVTPPAPPAPAPPPAAPKADCTASLAKGPKQVLKKVMAGGIGVTVKCTGAVAVGVKVSVPAPGAKKLGLPAGIIGTATGNAVAGSSTVIVRLSAGASKKIKSKSKKAKGKSLGSVATSVIVTFRDGAGNESVRTLALTLK